MGMFGDIDDKLARIHQELKFIARTIARLRHGHHVSVVLFSKHGDNRLLVQEAIQGCMQSCTKLLSTLFGAQRVLKDDNDIERTPKTPRDEREDESSGGLAAPKRERRNSTPAPFSIRNPTRLRPHYLKRLSCPP
jgi:hypothetical protein